MGLDGIKQNLGASLYAASNNAASGAKKALSQQAIEIVKPKADERVENQTTRAKLDQLVKTSQVELAQKTELAELNKTLAAYGCRPVTFAQYKSVENVVNQTVLPELDIAGNIATTARAEASIAQFENYMQALA